MLTLFITNLFETYMELHFTYLEINPLVVTENQIFILDLASKIDQTADYLCKTKWGGEIEFPPPFGRDAYPEVKIFYLYYYKIIYQSIIDKNRKLI
jgi:ATP citrate (pro-S)-lyase